MPPPLNPFNFKQYGRANENTPSAWKAGYKDFSAPPTGEIQESTPLAETTERMDVLTAPPVQPVNGDTEEKPKNKKRKKKDADVEEDAGAEEEPETGDGGEKKKKKKKKSKSDE